MPLLRLPNELLLLVAENLNAKDLNSLLRTSHRLAHLLTSPLYALTTQHGKHAAAAYKCAARNKLDGLVKFMLSRGANIEATDDQGWTALVWATMVGNVAAATVLLDNGANMRDALHSAARWGWPRVVELLLDRGAGVNRWIPGWATPLHTAAMYGRESVVRVLLEHGADLGAEMEMPNSAELGTPAQIAIYFGQEGVAKMLLEASSAGG